MEKLKRTKRTNVKDRKHLFLAEVTITLQHGLGCLSAYYTSHPELIPEHAVSNLSFPGIPQGSDYVFIIVKKRPKITYFL